MVNIEKPPKGIDPVTYDYLYQLSEFLGVTLANAPAAAVQSAPALSAASSPSAPSSSASSAPTDLAELKSLIIKTADDVAAGVVAPQISGVYAEIDGTNQSVRDLDASVKATYAAKSDFGTLLLELNRTIENDPNAITQYYKFFSDFKSLVDEEIGSMGSAVSEQAKIAAYIKSGIVEYDENLLPKVGIAIGQSLETETTVDGETEVLQKNFRATFTADRLAFWQGENCVAYVSNNKLNIETVTALKNVEIEDWLITAEVGLAFKWNGG